MIAYFPCYSLLFHVLFVCYPTSCHTLLYDSTWFHVIRSYSMLLHVIPCCSLELQRYVMLCDVILCCSIPFHSFPCFSRLFHYSTSFYSILLHANPWEFHAIPPYSILFASIPCHSMLWLTILCDSILFHMIPPDSKRLYVIPWYSEQEILDLWFSLGIRQVCGPQYAALSMSSPRLLYFHAALESKRPSRSLSIVFHGSFQLARDDGPSAPEMLTRETIIWRCFLTIF